MPPADFVEGPAVDSDRSAARRGGQFVEQIGAGRCDFDFFFHRDDSFKNVKHSVIFENRSAPGRADRKTTRQRTPSDGRADAGPVRRDTLFFKCLTMIKLMRHLRWTFVGKTKTLPPPPRYADAVREVFVRPTCKKDSTRRWEKYPDNPSRTDTAADRSGWRRGTSCPRKSTKNDFNFCFSSFVRPERPEKQVFFVIFAPIRKGWGRGAVFPYRPFRCETNSNTKST